MRREFALGTFTQLEPGPFACAFVKARALCSDGIVRNVSFRDYTGLPDTYFSVPCSVRVRNKDISGYVTYETISGSSVETDDDPWIVKFVANTYGKNYKFLPNIKTIKEPTAA